jgi:hypothetical protein
LDAELINGEDSRQALRPKAAKSTGIAQPVFTVDGNAAMANGPPAVPHSSRPPP